MSHEIFRCMVSWAMNLFFEKSVKLHAPPPSYILNLEKWIQNISVMIDEELSPKIALSEGGSRGNIVK